MAQAAIPIVIAVIGAAATVYSSVQQGAAQKKASNRAAELARAAAAREAADAAKQHQRVIATQEATYGASGLTMEGSPLLVKQTSLRESQEELRRILEGGSNLSSMYETEGKESQAAGNIGAITAATKGAGSVYNVYNNAPEEQSPKNKEYNWFE